MSTWNRNKIPLNASEDVQLVTFRDDEAGSKRNYVYLCTVVEYREKGLNRIVLHKCSHANHCSFLIGLQIFSLRRSTCSAICWLVFLWSLLQHFGAIWRLSTPPLMDSSSWDYWSLTEPKSKTHSCYRQGFSLMDSQISSPSSLIICLACSAHPILAYLWSLVSDQYWLSSYALTDPERCSALGRLAGSWQYCSSWYATFRANWGFAHV